MDLRMKAEKVTETGEKQWDVKVIDGIVPILTDEEENQQTATLAAFLIKGTIPQLPEVGIPWTDYVTGKITFGDLDALIRDAIIAAGQDTYHPEYDLEGEEITISIGKNPEA